MKEAEEMDAPFRDNRVTNDFSGWFQTGGDLDDFIFYWDTLSNQRLQQQELAEEQK